MSQPPAANSPSNSAPRPTSATKRSAQSAEIWSGPWARWRIVDERHVDDERLLLAAIDEHPSLADTLVDDQAIDAFLHVAAASEKDGSQFVAEVLRALGQRSDRAILADSDEALEAELEPVFDAANCERVLQASEDIEAGVGVAPPIVAPPVAAPPIAAPPVALSTHLSAAVPPASVEGLRVAAHRSRRSLRFPILTLAGAILALGGLLALYVFFDGGATPSSPEPQWAQSAPAHGVPHRPLAAAPESLTVRSTQDQSGSLQPVVWRTGGPIENRLPPGRHELARGFGQVPAHDQLALELFGPAVIEVDATGDVELQRGQVRLNGAAAAPGRRTTIRTPLTVVSDLDGMADLRVAEEGETDIVIREGKLTVKDRRAATPAAPPIQLTAGEFDRLHLATPPERLSTPVVFSEVSGPGGRFLGRIDVNGEPLEFGSPAIFRRMREQSMRQLAQSPQEFLAAWSAFAQSLAAQTGGGAAGLTGEGRSPSETAADAFFGMSFASEWNGDGDESFEATIVVDGERRTFHSRAEFEKAQRQLADRWRQLLSPAPQAP